MSDFEEHTISFSLELNAEPFATECRKAQAVTYRFLGLVRRATGSEDLNRALVLIQRHIALVNRARLAYAAFHAARMAAGDPLAWATAAVGIGEFVVSAGDLLMEAGS